MGKFQRLPKEMVLDAIRGSGGIVLVVMKKLGMKSWTATKNLINKREETRTAFQEEAEGMLDVAESVVAKSISNGDISTAKWYLTKKGKERGYSDDFGSMLTDSPLKIEFDGQATREGMEASPDIEVNDGTKAEGASE